LKREAGKRIEHVWNMRGAFSSAGKAQGYDNPFAPYHHSR
jgi:hypothetical protein